MLESLLPDLRRRMEGAVEVLSKDFAGLRTGRASVALLEPIVVDAYGSNIPITQVGSINVSDARTLSVQVWDQELMASVEKAIREAGLGLNPVVAGQLIRVPMPELSEERRGELAKVAKKYAETARVAIRNVRRDGMDTLKKSEKSNDISKDDHHRKAEEVQSLTDQHIKKVDDTLATKETDIMKV